MRKRPNATSKSHKTRSGQKRGILKLVRKGARNRHESANGGGENLWRVKDVARYLQISPAQVYKLVDLKEIPFLIVPERNLRFDPEDVRRFKEVWKVPLVEAVRPGRPRKLDRP